MKQKLQRSIPIEKIIKGIILGLALIIGIVLLVAVYGKIFYPSEVLKNFDRWISLFEILLLAAIISFRKYKELWLIVAPIFAAWGGYSIFWAVLELPCSCMGTLVHIPTLFSIIIDLIFFCSSLIVSYLLGTALRFIYLSFLCSLFSSLIGFAFAQWVYKYFVLKDVI